MKIVLFGKDGQVGTEIAGSCGRDGVEVVAFDSAAADITRLDQVEAAFKLADMADLAINAAAYTAVDKAEEEKEMALAVNAAGAANVARAAAQRDMPVLHLSTDYVFDGLKHASYVEEDAVAPVNAYGASKLAGEVAVHQANPKHVIIRTSWVFSAHGSNFVKTMLRLADTRPELSVVADQRGCPTAASDIADMLLGVGRQCVSADVGAVLWGIYHFCGAPETSWFEFAEHIFRLGPTQPKVRPIETKDYPTAAARPANTVMSCAKILENFGIEQPDWRQSLAQVIADLHRDKKHD